MYLHICISIIRKPNVKEKADQRPQYSFIPWVEHKKPVWANHVYVTSGTINLHEFVVSLNINTDDDIKYIWSNLPDITIRLK